MASVLLGFLGWGVGLFGRLTLGLSRCFTWAVGPGLLGGYRSAGLRSCVFFFFFFASLLVACILNKCFISIIFKPACGNDEVSGRGLARGVCRLKKKI